MKKLLLTTAMILATTPVFAAEFTIKEVTDYDAKKQNFFSPDKLTIQPGDTVTFENVQDEAHQVMFVSVTASSPSVKRSVGAGMLPFTVIFSIGLPVMFTGSCSIVSEYSDVLACAGVARNPTISNAIIPR